MWKLDSLLSLLRLETDVQKRKDMYSMCIRKTLFRTETQTKEFEIIPITATARIYIVLYYIHITHRITNLKTFIINILGQKGK